MKELTAAELIQILQQFPGSAKVVFSYADGCEVCNEESLDFYHSVSEVSFKKRGDYPNCSQTDIVVME